MGAVTARMNALRKICVQLFNKLRGTAEFLENILETLGETEEGRELLEKINDLRFDLDKSLGEARLIADDIQSRFQYVHKIQKMILSVVVF